MANPDDIFPLESVLRLIDGDSDPQAQELEAAYSEAYWEFLKKQVPGLAELEQGEESSV